MSDLTDPFQARFSGVARLFGQAGLERLRAAHVCVVGVGGVGSWAVEALARSGVGALTLVDPDDVCVSNTNRQLPALEGGYGLAKVTALAERVRAIHPDCRLLPLQEFFNETSADRILGAGFAYVLDAIDSPAQKCRLIAGCRERGLPIFVTGGAGGRRDPTALRVADLAKSTHDRLLAEVRSQLRKHHGFPGEGSLFGIDCVYSPEPVVYPARDGGVCAQREPGSELRLDCESGYGTACFVTGAFGFAAAGRIVQALAAGPAPAMGSSPA
ncbi:MAG: hypothetical protein RJA22_45 [Verrucomicrobiota bacterium]|jgi:tRNA A37 threonylcarbamoyladenosine dehydratase